MGAKKQLKFLQGGLQKIKMKYIDKINKKRFKSRKMLIFLKKTLLCLRYCVLGKFCDV